MLAHRYRHLSFLWAAVVVLSLAAALACSSSEQTTGVAAPHIEKASRTVTKIANASILITSDLTEQPEISRVEVAPSSIVLDRGESIALEARAFGPEGQLLTDVEFVWTVVDPRAGNIGNNGEFQAGPAPGVYNHSVSVTGVQNSIKGLKYASATAPVTIVGETVPSKLETVAILPGEPTVSSGQIFRLWAVGFDQDGLVIPGVDLSWKVNDPFLGRVSNTGYLTVEADDGRFSEAVTVSASWDGAEVSATTDIVVLSTKDADDFINVQVLPRRFFMAPGDQLRLRAFALNGLGELMAGTQLRWSMAKPTAGIVDGNGMFIGGDTPGVYTEAVRVEAIVPGEQGFIRAEDFASVVIRSELSSRQLEAVRVLPGSITVGPGGRTLLLAQPVDLYGEPAEDVKITWAATSDTVGAIDEFGSYTASDTPGTYADALIVTAEQTVGGETLTKTASVDVIITGTLTELEVRPTLATISPRRTIHFSLTGRDENGVSLTGLVALWSVTDDSIGTVDAFGNFTAGPTPGFYQDAIRVEVKHSVPTYN